MQFIIQENEIELNNGICSVYFYSNWMPFHKKMLSILDKMENKYKDIKHLAIDIDQLKTVVKRFDIESVPTTLIFKDGKEIKRIVGIVLTSAMRSAYADI